MSGGGQNQFSTFDAESKFAKKNPRQTDKNWNGFVLDFEFQVVPLYEV